MDANPSSNDIRPDAEMPDSILPESRPESSNRSEDARPESYQQKRVVIEKLPTNMLALTENLGYTKARNRDLKRAAVQERERVSSIH
jgi:hypothetical protein